MKKPNYDYFLCELESNRLEVGLIDAPEKRHYMHCIRVCFSRNPVWYQKLCAKFSSDDKSKSTTIRRKDIVRILNRLIQGQSVNSKYLQPLNQILNETTKNRNLGY